MKRKTKGFVSWFWPPAEYESESNTLTVRQNLQGRNTELETHDFKDIFIFSHFNNKGPCHYSN